MGTGLAALLLVGSMIAYVTSGEGSASAHGGGNKGPTTSVYQTLPACRVDVTTNGIGSERHHHVTVVMDNDLPKLWLKIESPVGTRVVEVPARNGWAQLALPSEEQPSKVVVFGSENLEGFTAGCAWSSHL